MKRITHSIGDPVGSQEQVFKTAFGWRKLKPYLGHEQAEQRVAEALTSDFGVYITRAGARSQSYDIEICDGGWKAESKNISPGLYEVKSLWRKDKKSSFDKRFKVGTRGEKIYGRRDSQIKSFALLLEREIDSLVENNLTEGKPASPDENMRLVEETHQFIDQAIMRKHSKSFEDRLNKLACASLKIPNLTISANTILSGKIRSGDIVRGFSDIEGIFIVAGPIYTLITKTEIPTLLHFDSASSEGPKLRIIGDIPSEHGNKEIRSKTSKIQKGKKSK